MPLTFKFIFGRDDCIEIKVQFIYAFLFKSYLQSKLWIRNMYQKDKRHVTVYLVSNSVEIMYISTYSLSPNPALIIRYFEVVCFLEPLEGIYAFCVLYVIW